MTFHRWPAFLFVITWVMLTVRSVHGQAAPATVGSATPLPREDVLELFGGAAHEADRVEHSPGVDTAGQQLTPGEREGEPADLTLADPARDRFHDSESKPLRRPDTSGWLSGARVAGDHGPQSGATQAGLADGFWSSLRNWLPLITVLALIALAVWVLKRFMPTRRLLGGAGVLEIVARAPLSAKQSLILVKMGRRLVLLGVTTERINALCVVDDPDQVALLLGEVASQRGGSMTQAFTQAFEEEAAQYAVEVPESHPAEQTGNEVRGLLDKIRRLKRGREVA